MSKEFWNAIHFGLRCARADYDESYNLQSIVDTQHLFSIDDVNFVIFPVLYRYNMVMTSSSYLTREGTMALSDLDRGVIPQITMSCIRMTKKELHAAVISNDNSIWYDNDGDFHGDQEGYLAFITAMLQLRLSSSYVDMEWYLWNQILLILNGHRPPCRVILLGLFEQNDTLKRFLNERIKVDNQEEFETWMKYVTDISPSY